MDDEAQTRRQVLQPQLYTPELGYPQVLRQEGLLAQMKRGEAVTSMLDVYNRYCPLVLQPRGRSQCL